jgi:N utilization substance protein A
MALANEGPSLDDIITQVAKDKGIEKSTLLASLEEAMRTAAKKHFGQ